MEIMSVAVIVPSFPKMVEALGVGAQSIGLAFSLTGLNGTFYFIKYKQG